MKKPNYKQIFARQKRDKERILKVNPDVPDRSGIYFLYRTQKRMYVGQAGGYRTDEHGNRVRVKQGMLTRLAQHLENFQRIDISIKAHGLYDAEKNPDGYRIAFKEFPPEELDEKEQYYIQKCADEGMELLNLTSGSQGIGKKKIADYKPAKNYSDGLKQGRKNLAKELSHIIEKHLVVSLKPEKQGNKVSEEQYQKFLHLLDESTYEEEKDGGQGEIQEI